MTMDAVLSLCRAAEWDADVFARARPWLARLGRDARPDQLELLLRGTERMLSLDYPASRARDVPFEAARAFQALGWFRRAAELFRESIARLGAVAASALNLGLCLAALGEADEAATWMRRAGELDPSTGGQGLARRCLAQASSSGEGATVRLSGGRVISLGLP